MFHASLLLRASDYQRIIFRTPLRGVFQQTARRPRAPLTLAMTEREMLQQSVQLMLLEGWNHQGSIFILSTRGIQVILLCWMWSPWVLLVSISELKKIYSTCRCLVR